jgi:hypothetical protein
MAKHLVRLSAVLAFVLGVSLLQSGYAQEKESQDAKEAESKSAETAATPTEAAGDSKPDEKSATASRPSTPPHDVVLKDAKAIEGLIPLYQKDAQLFAELTSSHYANEYLILISIARGISQGMLLGGMTWSDGDDWVWQFRKVGKNVHVVRRNVRFKAKSGSPEASAVKNAYTDSVLFSLPIVTKGPKGGDLIDLSPVFMSDLPQISFALPGFMFSANKSNWDDVKGFRDNVELKVAATYSSSGRETFDTVPDSRGVTITVHYSISKIPTTGYQPRLADDRVGYFLTVVKDFSKQGGDDQFVRYINRWNLQKADSSADISPPKEPLIFWIEKTVPFKYRKPIREGILEWNKAFEKAGLVNAIEVRQQPDEVEWDPEDVNYNTFRWITANASFAMGPSRVNPYTGEILDADVIFDADFLTYWKQEFETFSPETAAAMTTGISSLLDAADLGSGSSPAGADSLPGVAGQHRSCQLSRGMTRQFAFGAAALMAEADPGQAAELQEKMIMQGLKEVAMHEIGHTLGLRHNFKASTYRSLQELNDPAKNTDGSLTASVMDYAPTNIVPRGQQQGDYFSTTIGPYDYWAIEYGYKQFTGSEAEELKKIASRSGEPALRYATDEDTRGLVDADPEANRFDLGGDALEFATQRAELMKQLIPDLAERAVAEGDDYSKARKAFNVILAQYGQAMYFASRYVGGVYGSRSHKGDPDAPAPLRVVPAEKQRAALALLEQNVFSDKPFDFPPELYNQLALSNWDHWGMSTTLRKDFPVHEVILMWQERILDQLLVFLTLERIHDAELKIPPGEDAFTAAELIERLTKTVFDEVYATKGGNYTNRKPAISSLRRNLQRSYLRSLSYVALGQTGAPQDCQTLAYVELDNLKQSIEKLLNSKVKLDTYSNAHLRESASRIDKVLDARLSLSSP